MRQDSFTLQGHVYIYREPTHGEIKTARSKPDLDAEEFLCSCCLIYPVVQSWDYHPAGIPTQVARKIIELGGLTPEHQDQMEETLKEWSDSLEGKQEILMMCMLGYTPEQIDSFDNTTWNKAASAAAVGAIIKGYGEGVQNFMTSGQPVEDTPAAGYIPPTTRMDGTQEIESGGFIAAPRPQGRI